MIIDMHVHTKPFSLCSTIEPEEAVREAKRIGLDGLCFTEHNRIWDAEAVQALSSKWDFLVLRGMEVETIEGHVLVFGFHQDIKKLVHVSELRDMVEREGGVMVAAHPFKGFLLFGVSDLKLSVEQASRRPIFQMTDLVETFSGKATKDENEFAQKVCQNLGKKGTGGSDAHELHGFGRCATFFENRFNIEAELVAELQAGRFRSDYFLKQDEQRDLPHPQGRPT